jgi:FecR protein
MRANIIALLIAAALLPTLILVDPAAPQGSLAGMAKQAGGVLVVVRSDGIENRLQGRGALQLFELDTLQATDGPALVETEEGIQIALNAGTVAKLLSRWQKGKPLTRIVRLQRGEVWVRAGGPGVAFEVETINGVLAAASSEVYVKEAENGDVTAAVLAGQADFSTPFTTCTVRSGTVSYASAGKPCTAPIAFDVRSLSSWTRVLLTP